MCVCSTPADDVRDREGEGSIGPHAADDVSYRGLFAPHAADDVRDREEGLAPPAADVVRDREGEFAPRAADDVRDWEGGGVVLVLCLLHTRCRRRARPGGGRGCYCSVVCSTRS